MPAWLAALLANPLTTSAGALSLLYAILGLFGIDVPGLPHVTPEMAGPLVLGGITGLLAKDGHK